MAELSINQKKEWALLLFIRERGMSQKAIAEKVGVSEKTISKWANAELWENLRKSLIVTKEEQLRRMYNQLDKLIEAVDKKDEGYASSKEGDTMTKYTAAIRNLETETSLTETFEVGKKFILWVQTNDFEKAKDITSLFDGFIREQLKRS